MKRAFYWTLENTGRMDDVDLVEFVNRMKQIKAAVLPRAGRSRLIL